MKKFEFKYQRPAWFPEETAWDKLSLEEKAAMIQVAVKNGITWMDDIKQKYNEFAAGGHIYDGEKESTQKMQMGYNYWQQLANQPTYYDKVDPPINGGVLSEVIVTPTDDQNWLFSQGRYKHNSRKPLADASTRKMVANYLSQYENENAQSYNDRIKRLADIIYATNGVIFKANEAKEGKHKNRAYYNPREEIGYVTTMPDLLAELSHPYQEWFGNNKDQDEYNMSNYDSDSDPRGGTRYAYPDTYEGETHGFFEPALTEWVETGKISRSLPFLNEDRAKEKITPKDWHEVVDSAKSWNQQAIDKRVLPMPSQLDPWSRIKYSITDFPLLEKKKAFGGYFKSNLRL